MNEPLLASGLQHLRGGAAAKAEALARQALLSKPDEPAAHYLLALIAFQQGQLDTASTHFSLSLAQYPQAPAEWHANYANLHRARNDANAAIRHFQLACQRNPDLLPARLNLAELLLNTGQAAAAAEHYRLALTRQADNFAAASGLAYALTATNQFTEAQTIARQLLASHPDSAEAYFTLGNVLSESGEQAAARNAFQIALQQDPSMYIAAINLAASWRSSGDYAPAYRQLLAVQQRLPELREAHHLLAHTVAQECANTPSTPCSHLPTETSSIPLLSIIVCSINADKLAATRRMYAELLADQPYELIHIGDARSLCEGYNRGLNQSHGDVVIFAHDDIEILNPDFTAIIGRALSTADLIGVAGTRRLLCYRWGDAGWPHQQGWVAHPGDNGGVELAIFRIFAAQADAIQGLDGLFFAARRVVAEAIRFDDQTFDGFHFYDLDFSYRAFLAGYRLAVCNELTIVHHSRGGFDTRWQSYAERFAAKHRATLPGEPGASGSAAMVHFATHAELQHYCRRYLDVLTTFAPDGV